jgi:hypothetical protein
LITAIQGTKVGKSTRFGKGKWKQILLDYLEECAGKSFLRVHVRKKVLEECVKGRLVNKGLVSRFQRVGRFFQLVPKTKKERPLGGIKPARYWWPEESKKERLFEELVKTVKGMGIKRMGELQKKRNRVVEKTLQRLREKGLGPKLLSKNDLHRMTGAHKKKILQRAKRL